VQTENSWDRSKKVQNSSPSRRTASSVLYSLLFLSFLTFHKTKRNTKNVMRRYLDSFVSKINCVNNNI
jgi:hypothetical protein